MSPLRLRLLLAAALCLSTAALAEAPPDAKAAFTSLKTLAGAWEGQLTTDLKEPDPSLPQGAKVKIWLRVTSMGNALMHEMKVESRPDNLITMLYLDEGRLLLTHYCDAGNRPRMVAKPSADDKTVAYLMDYRKMSREDAERLCAGLESDPDAEYCETIEIDAAAIRPSSHIAHDGAAESTPPMPEIRRLAAFGSPTAAATWPMIPAGTVEQYVT